MREIAKSIFYFLRGGVAWRLHERRWIVERFFAWININ
jgi:transposase